MWLLVLFDLPVGSKKERKEAAGFRNTLLDLGFEMEQFSVYLRDCADKTKVESLIKQIERQLPPQGSIKMLAFTDKQYENIRNYRGPKARKCRENKKQLQLF